MYIFKEVYIIQKYINELQAQGLSVGFVPTMGALHSGHLSLIKMSKAKNDVTVCSIFVNPTQFNDATDLEKYPRTIEEDIELLNSVNCDVLFLPTVEEVYPVGLDLSVNIDLGSLDRVMEGEHRPGHFEGVMQVVKRLLDIVQPHHLYMGQKDFQQWRIIQKMVAVLGMSVEVVRCPIVREEDGLAMSSRNRLLPEAVRNIVPLIHQTLQDAKVNTSTLDVETVKKIALAKLNIPEFTIDYFEIADGNTLLPIDNFENSKFAIACVALFVANIRLIDNIVLYKNE